MSAAEFRLAPCGVVRAAAWPCEALADFGDPDLHAAVRPAAAEPPAGFERACTLALTRESDLLWQRTRDDPHFAKALLLASPSAYRRMESGVAKRAGPRNRALRLVEHTLFRYLSRAATRVTPNGLWAGVTDVRVGAANGVERCAPAARFTPALGPFQILLRGLGARDVYRDRLLWRLNPTLAATADGGWTFLHRPAGGGLEQRRLGFEPGLARLLGGLARAAPGSLTALATSAGPEGGAAAWLPVLRALAAGGVLVGGLDLPEKFATPWAALEAAGERLPADDARAWREALRMLSDRCSALGEAVWTSTPEHFAAHLEAPAGVLTALAAALGLPAPETPGSLRCDLRLPWRLVVDRARHAALCAALAGYDRHWQRGASAAMAERAARRSRFVAGLGEGLGLAAAAALAASLAPAGAEVWPRAATLASREVGARLERWERCLRTADAAAVLDAAPDAAARDLAPYGCWLAGLDDRGTIAAHGVSDLPTIASARLADVLDLRRHDAWLAAAFAASGSPVFEYLAPFEPNPNALAGPALLDGTLAPWRACGADRDLRGARLVVDARRRRPLLELADGTRCGVLSLATANLQALDPLAEALLWTGYRDATGRARHAIDIPLADELEAPRYSPRVSLPGGAVLCGRRTLLGAELAGLRARRGPARFWYWQQLAKRYAWPPELEVGSDRGGMMRVVRDSPLAVEALCKGLGPETPWLMVRETQAAFTLPGGGCHVAELALPFLRRPSQTELGHDAR